MFEFTDITFQHKVWLEGFYPDVASNYTEALCSYFDDLDLNEGYDNFVNQGFASAQEAAIVIPFHKMLDNYIGSINKEGLTDIVVLNDPDWHEVVNFGFATWQQLKAHLNNTEEQGFMLQLEDKYL
ncbi:hypothetical protein AM493_13385 [Flavobacterium akiainvivens]|uniref:Uncharacterized protein n=1 Tax=Flavobacterium akiainvivens TaxID=1202724 RepID=A0A0M9VIR4_9FLAO|nr:hypothetical protein AM493_13385 [Flavobacterium akiainvivens]